MATVGSSIRGSSTVIDERIDVPKIENVALTLAATEVAHALTAGSKQFQVLNRNNGKLQLSYSVGTSGTVFQTIPPGCFYREGNIDPSVSITLYMQSPIAAQTVEVASWT